MSTLPAWMPTMSLIALLLLSPQVGDESLPEVVLLDFTAGYCQPCQEMVPIFQRMEQDHFPIRTVDISENPELARQYRVERIPTMILMVEGREVTRFVGRQAESKLRRSMNQAAEELDKRRQAARSPKVDVITADVRTAAEPPARKVSPLERILDLFRKGDPNLHRPTFRANNDMPQTADGATPRPSTHMASSVRIQVADKGKVDVGSGTIIHSEPGGSLILTCGHLFDQANKDAKIQVEVFRESGPAVTYVAELVDYNIEADVGLIAIQNSVPLASATLVPEEGTIAPDDAVVSTGCSDGAPPSAWPMKIVTVNRYDGPDNFECTEIPAHGRSGGAVFNGDGRIIGICSAAFKERGYGLYAGHKPAYELLRRNDLLSVLREADAPTPVVKEVIVEDNSPQAESVSETEYNEDTDWLEKSLNEGIDQLAADLPAQLGSVVTPAVLQNVDDLARKADLAGDADVVCYIRSKDGTSPPRMIVIPRATPWLMDVLTGDTSAARISQDIQTVSQRPIRPATERRPSRQAGIELIPSH